MLPKTKQEKKNTVRDEIIPNNAADNNTLVYIIGFFGLILTTIAVVSAGFLLGKFLIFLGVNRELFIIIYCICSIPVSLRAFDFWTKWASSRWISPRS